MTTVDSAFGVTLGGKPRLAPPKAATTVLFLADAQGLRQDGDRAIAGMRSMDRCGLAPALNLGLVYCHWSSLIQIDFFGRHGPILLVFLTNTSTLAIHCFADNQINPQARDCAGLYWPGRTLAPSGPARLSRAVAADRLTEIIGAGLVLRQKLREHAHRTTSPMRPYSLRSPRKAPPSCWRRPCRWNGVVPAANPSGDAPNAVQVYTAISLAAESMALEMV
jgi:hypothetical protein